MPNTNNPSVKLIKQMEQNVLFQNRKEKMLHTYLHTYTYTKKHNYEHQGNGNLSNILSACDSKVEDKFCNSNAKYLELVKKKFQVCCTPKICDKTVKSVLKPECPRNQLPTMRDQILTSRANAKSNSPYRTLSHFGFDKPVRDPKPNHKHLAVKMEKELKYVPLRRSVSYEDIFSSPRYLNLCESCFESIVRLKPHLIKCKTKLHSIIKCSDESRLLFTTEKKYPYDTNDNLCLLNDSGDLSERDSMLELNEPYSTFFISLSKDEDESIPQAITNSTFNEKITCLNYSELSSNNNSTKTPHKLLSPNSMCECKDCFLESSHLSKKKCNNNIADVAICDKNRSSQADIEYEDNNICDFVEKQLQKTKPPKCEFFENTVKIRDMEENSKKLMDREERSRRKLEFQELWEDHVNIAEQQENDILFPIMQSQKKIYNDGEPRNRETLNDQNSGFSLTNKDVEEFKSTLSHITFHSTQRYDVSKPKETRRICSNRELESPKFEINVSDNSSQVFHLPKNSIESVVNESESGFHRSFNESSENTDKFSILERTILEKIHTKDLNKSDKIFGKIENTIRNKVTPLELELKIKEHANMSTDENSCNEKENILSKPQNIFNEMVRSLPQLSSLSSFKANSSMPVFKLSQTETNGNNNEQLSTMSRYIKKSVLKKNKKCRNFILENIRNVSVPRQSPRIKPTAHNFEHELEKKHTLLSSSRIQGRKNNKILSPLNSSSSAVYSFESKLVRGSPRFWISMSQRSTKKDRQSSSPAKIRKVTCSSEEHLKSTVNSSLATSRVEGKTLSNVDAEIDALGDEIQQIQPRLENYKRKLDDFGHRVADCVNNINECVTTQENIRSVQRKLKDCIKLREYTEQIMCRVETFSLSETED